MVANNKIRDNKRGSVFTLAHNEKLQVYDSCDFQIDRKKEQGYRITIEPLMFSVLFISTCTNGVTIDIIERNLFCRSQPENCSLWSGHNKLFRESLNGEAAHINMIIRLVQGTFPLITSMFIGPWSDTNGRKPFMISTLTGYLAFTILWSAMSLFHFMNPYLFVLPSIPLSISGGQLALYLCSYCYITDVTHASNRTVRFSMMHSSAMVGNLLGTLSVIVVEYFCPDQNYSYLIILCMCSAVATMGLMHAVLVLQETVERKDKWDFLFNLEFVKSVATCLFEKSPKELLVTLLTIFMLFFDISIKKGEKIILYLVGLDQFSWSLSYFNFFSMSIIFISALTSSGGSILVKKYLGWPNLSIILVCALIVFSSEVLRAITKTELQFWVMSALCTTTTLVTPAVNAEIASLASKKDMGKIYAFNALIDSLVPFVALSLYSEVYELLVDHHRVLHVYLISAGSAVLIGISVMIVMMLRSSRSYEVSNHNLEQ